MTRTQFRTPFVICLALTLFGTCSLYSQQNGVPVHLIVTVEPRHGSEVPSVSREDVMVYEGKERDQVTDWVPAQGDRAGLEVFILIDDFSSPALGTQLSSIKEFINAQPAGAKVGVAYMQNGIVRVEQNLTDDHDLAAKSLRQPLGIGGINASPYFSLSDLIKRWPETASRREVLMTTSGVDLYYGVGDIEDPYLAAAIKDAQRAGIVVSAIYTPGTGHVGHSYWLNYWGQIYLSQLTEETGGEAYYIGFTGTAPDFTPYLKDASLRMAHQYLLTFLAKPEKKSGMRSIKLRTELPNVDLVSANAVYVPASE